METKLKYWPLHAKMSLRAYANNEGPDQPAHSRSQIMAFVCPLTEQMDTTACINGEQMPE